MDEGSWAGTRKGPRRTWRQGPLKSNVPQGGNVA
jgi:hypothetical protein